MANMGGGAERKNRRQEEQERATCGSNAGFFYGGDDSVDDELAKFMPANKRRLDEEARTLNFMGGIDLSNEEFFRENDDKENAIFDRRHSFYQSRRRQGSGRITTPRPIDFDKLLKTGASILCGSLSKNIMTAPLKENVNDRENAVSDRNSFHQSRRRQGSGRITTPRPIDFDKLLKTGASTPSGSLYKNITTALKVNVNKAELQSQIVDDFRSTEKKVSAVARRRLSGVEIPAQTNPKPVEDRHARHARSRRGGRNSRKLGERSINLDLGIDAAKIADWDQEILAEEVAPASRANCGAYLAAGRLALQGNLADLDEGRKEVAVQPGGVAAARRDDGIQGDGSEARLEDDIQGDRSEARLEDDIQGDRSEARLEDDIQGDRSQARLEDDIQGDRSEPNLGRDEPFTATSPSSMEVSAGQSPLVEVPDILGRGKHGVDSRQDYGSVNPDVIMENFFWKEPTVPDRIILEDRDDVGAIGQDSSCSSGRSRCEREDHDSHPKEIVTLDPRPRDSNIEQKDSLMTPCKGFSILGSSNLHIQRTPATSPTPPSNPVAVYTSRYLGEDLQQRRLAFHSSPSSQTMESSRGREEQKSDSGEIQSSGDTYPGMEQFMTSTKEVHDGKCVLEVFEPTTDLCNFKLDQMSTSKGDVEGENMDLVVADSRRGSYQGGLRHMTASKDEVECEKIDFVGAESWIDSSDGGLHCMTPSKVKGVRMVFGEGELLRDLCNRREHQMNASKDDIQGAKVLVGEIEPRRDLCHFGTHQMSAVGDYVQVQELENPSEISRAVPCDGETLQEDNQVRDLPEESLFVASCDRSIHHVDDEVRAQKAGEAERDKAGSSVRCDDNKSGQDHIVNRTACDRSLGEYGLQARLHDDAANDEDLVVPDITETEPVHHESNGIILPEQTDPNRIVPNHEDVAESVDEVAIKNKAQIPSEKAIETGDSEAVPACVDAQQKNATTETVIGSDEGSTTQTGPKESKRRRVTKSLQDRRSSLEGSGSAWTDGQRRSLRMRFKPLEWWRGEKLLYGRVHQSLTTVIGIKRSSPGKYALGVDNPFIVESYVPDKYSELVRLAAI